MNILYVITQADLGGAQKYVLSLAKNFNGTIAAGTESQELFLECRKLGIETFKLKNLKRNVSPVQDFLAMWEIRQLVEKLRPDIVHLNSSKAGILGSLASAGISTKVIFTAHGFVFNEPGSYFKKSGYLALEKIASDFRDYIITVSEADRKSALENNLIRPEKISTVYNGINKINFLEINEAKNFLGINSNKITFGTIANYYQSKGLDILISSISKIPKNLRGKTEFIFIGSGLEEQNLKNQVNKLGLENIVKIFGEVNEAKIYLKAFNAFILPSRKEGFPYALLEAMQAGLPIIATNAGGNKEALGQAGIIVEKQNPQELTKAIVELIKNPELQKDLGSKAKVRSEEFTENRMIKETEDIYKKILS